MNRDSTSVHVKRKHKDVRNLLQITIARCLTVANNIYLVTVDYLRPLLL